MGLRGVSVAEMLRRFSFLGSSLRRRMRKTAAGIGDGVRKTAERT